jgi:hypothetical protein
LCDARKANRFVKSGSPKGPPTTVDLGWVRRLVGPAAAAVVVLLQVLLSLAELRRPVFFLVSILAASLLLLLAAWYLLSKQMVLAILSLGGFVLVGILSLVSIPSEQTELVRAGGAGPTVAQPPGPTATPSAPSHGGVTDGPLREG